MSISILVILYVCVCVGKWVVHTSSIPHVLEGSPSLCRPHLHNVHAWLSLCARLSMSSETVIFKAFIVALSPYGEQGWTSGAQTLSDSVWPKLWWREEGCVRAEVCLMRSGAVREGSRKKRHCPGSCQGNKDQSDQTGMARQGQPTVSQSLGLYPRPKVGSSVTLRK